VVIDAGHGGQDPGAPSVVKGRNEKEATLAVAKAIKAELDASGKVKAILTRATDVYIPLGGRAAIARAAGADLFMSIHADSIAKPDIRGATIYTLSQTASDKEAEKLAEKENKADIITGINLGGESPDVTSILIDLTQRETMNYSAEFAQVAVREMSSKIYFRSNFHRFAGFAVLKAPDVPSVLIETGYMSNEDDSKFLFSGEGQKAIALGVRKAVERYFERRVEK
jgi:N-acetylmuramoyl-L-alanine amidase